MANDEGDLTHDGLLFSLPFLLIRSMKGLKERLGSSLIHVYNSFS